MRQRRPTGVEQVGLNPVQEAVNQVGEERGRRGESGGIEGQDTMAGRVLDGTHCPREELHDALGFRVIAGREPRGVHSRQMP